MGLRSPNQNRNDIRNERQLPPVSVSIRDLLFFFARSAAFARRAFSRRSRACRGGGRARRSRGFCGRARRQGRPEPVRERGLATGPGEAPGGAPAGRGPARYAGATRGEIFLAGSREEGIDRGQFAELCRVRFASNRGVGIDCARSQVYRAQFGILCEGSLSFGFEQQSILVWPRAQILLHEPTAVCTASLIFATA
ncbi:MAG: hypothetical protein QOF91_1808 [Alphaproteobacteria bacterium]|nr:hypothetical protein [Alphaproteobacteria bacterium]